MSTDGNSDELSALRRESQAIWNQIAPAWDDYMGEGRSFQNVLIGPTTERLLDVQAGQLILDIACGNGAFARRLAQLGAQVVACDFSQEFIRLAKARTTEHVDRIAYYVIDATDEAQLLALGARRFDAAVCTMGISRNTTSIVRSAPCSVPLSASGSCWMDWKNPLSTGRRNRATLSAGRTTPRSRPC